MIKNIQHWPTYQKGLEAMQIPNYCESNKSMLIQLHNETLGGHKEIDGFET